MREAEPRPGVGVLTAVLANAGRISPDVAGVVQRAVERRREQEHESIGAAHQLVVGRAYRRPQLAGVPLVEVRRRSRQDRPRLRDGVDAALAALRRTDERAIIVERAQVPASVPRHPRDGVTQRSGAGPPRRGQVGLAAGHRQRGEAIHHGAQEPAEPHALAAPLRTHAAHAVVPVAVSHEREPVHSLGHRTGQGPTAVLEERRRGGRGLVGRVAVVLVRSQRLGAEERHRLVEDPRVACRGDVLAHDVGEPGQVVRAAGAHAATGGRVPPVQDIALLELMLGRLEDVRARHPGCGVEQRQDVLELVAISERAARLIEACAAVHARRERLIQEPSIEHQVHRRLGRPDADASERLVPERTQFVPRRLDHGPVAKASHELQGRVAVGGLPEDEVRLELLAGRQLEMHLQGRARVGAEVDAIRQTPALQAFGMRVVAAAPEELGPICRVPVDVVARGDERDAPLELGVPAARREQTGMGSIELRHDVRSLLLALTAQDPLGVVGRRETSTARERVLHPEAHDLERRTGWDEDGQGLLEAVTRALVDRVAGAMADPGLPGLPRGQRRGRPDLRRLLVAEVQRLRRGVEHGIAAPRREAVLAAVE